MVARRVTSDDRPARRPATTSRGRELQLISLAYDLAEKQLTDGTASAQVISSLIKAGSARENLEQERLASENKLLLARVENLESQRDIKDLYENAITVMRIYQGQEVEEQYDGYD